MSKSKKSPKTSKGGKVPTTFVDRDLKKTNPLREQFEPTDSCPVRQHKRMGGVS
jgi:hypothetical protein